MQRFECGISVMGCIFQVATQTLREKFDICFKPLLKYNIELHRIHPKVSFLCRSGADLPIRQM